MRIYFWVCLISFAPDAFALPPPRGRSILSPETIPSETTAKSEVKQLAPEPKIVRKSRIPADKLRISQSSSATPPVNLPGIYHASRTTPRTFDQVVYVPQNKKETMKSVKSGDMFQAIIEQELKASPQVPTPIRAIVMSGNLRGGAFLGEAVLDRELKRILLQFKKVRTRDGKIYPIKASGLSVRGSVGLEGDYHTQSGKFFAAEMLAATSAGFLDATIQRNQTSFGTFVQEPSLSNTSKTGAVTALSRTADRMAESARQAPEYTTLEGMQAIQIIVEETENL